MGKFLTIAAAAAGLLGAVTAGCNTSGCQDNGSAIPLAAFCSSATGAPVTLDSLAIYGLGAPADSAVALPGPAIGSVYLPMRASAQSTEWKIEYRYRELDTPALYDTVTLGYESIPYFASADCGAMYAYRLRSVRHTTHLIDSITVTDSLITNVDRTSMQIFFRIATEGDIE